MTDLDAGPEMPPPGPSPSGQFALQEKDLLQVSITINACLLLQTSFGWVVKLLLSPRRGGGGGGFGPRWVHRRPRLVGKMFMEQSVLVVVMVMTIEEAFINDVKPFSHDAHAAGRLSLIFSISLGRFLVMAGNALLSDVVTTSCRHTGCPDGPRVHSLTGLTGKRGADFAYYAVCAVSNVLSLGYGENKLLVLTSSFMELNCLQVAWGRLSKANRKFTKTGAGLRSALLCGVVFSVTCIAMPVLFLVLALGMESPLAMSAVPLAWFIFCCLFYGLLHLWLLLRCSVRIARVAMTPTPQGHPSSGFHQPAGSLADRNSPCAPSGLRGLPSHELAGSQLQPTGDKSWSKLLTEFNYGFLHCYDVRRPCGPGMGDNSDAGQKKASPKVQGHAIHQ